jgi:hypothetical protein
LEIASTVEPLHDGRIHIEKINAPFLKEGGHAGAGLNYAILEDGTTLRTLLQAIQYLVKTVRRPNAMTRGFRLQLTT